MARGGKRPNAGRKAGAVTLRTRAIADQAVTTGQSPLEVMLTNMRFFQKVAIDAERTIEGLTAGEFTGGAELEPQDQFRLLLAKVTEAAGLRKLAQDCAKEAAPYVHPRLAVAEPAKRNDDLVPLAERVKEYAREDAIKASGGKVVAIDKRAGRGR